MQDIGFSDGCQSANRGRVLLVDDEASIRQSLTTVLARAGHSVRAVRSAEDGMRALRSEEFDCLVLDYRLPDLRGDVLYAFARLHQPRLVGHTLFVARGMTADSAAQIERCGCPVMEPPFDVSAFLALVDGMTAGLGGKGGAPAGPRRPY
jgi:DNA-binding NtrC family response regulator